MEVLLVNSLIYCLWTFFVYKKYGVVNIYFILVLMITSIAFLGLLTVVNGIYYDTFGINSNTRLSYEPYILCFLVYFILFYPLRALKLDYDSAYFIYKKTFRQIIKGWAFFYTFYLLLLLYESILSIVGGLGNAYEMRHIEGESLYKYDSTFISYIIKGYGMFIYNASSPVVLFYSIVARKKNKISSRFSSYLIILCLVPSILSGIGMGSRGSLFATAVCYSFYATLFWNLFSQSTKRRILRYTLLALSLMIFFSMIITVQRVGSKDSGSSILRYFGESFPNLGYIMYDKVYMHPMGIRFFPELVFGDNMPWDSTDESYRYWENITGVPVIVFKTFFGDLYIEFGTILALVITIIMSVIMTILIRKKLNIIILPFLNYYIQMCAQSFAGFNKTGYFSFFQLEITIIFTLCLLLLNKVASSKKAINNHII